MINCKTDGSNLNFPSPSSYISFVFLSFSCSLYWIFLLYLPRLPCDSYLVVIEQQQQQQPYFCRHKGSNLTHFYPPLRFRNQVPTLVGTWSLRGLRGAPEAPPLCRKTQSLGQQMLERWEKMG